MNELNFRRRDSRSCVYLSAISLLLFSLSASTGLASVIYEYREVGSAAVIGTLEFKSPPARATTGWFTENTSDVISLFMDDAVFGLGSDSVLPPPAGGTWSIQVGSTNGASLDGGLLAANLPPIFPSDPNDPIVEHRFLFSLMKDPKEKMSSP